MDLISYFGIPTPYPALHVEEVVTYVPLAQCGYGFLTLGIHRVPYGNFNSEDTSGRAVNTESKSAYWWIKSSVAVAVIQVLCGQQE